MNKKFYTLLTALLVFISFSSSAQFSKPFSIGIGAGGNMLYGDLKEKLIGSSGHVDLDVLMNPFISVGINAQNGKLKGNGLGKDKREVENTYSAVNANIKIRLGQFMPQAKNYSYYIMSDKSLTSYLANVYVGAGAGFVFNKVDAYREPGNEAFKGENESTEKIVPVNVGIDIPLGSSLYGPTWAVNVNYQCVFSLKDDLDGYSNDGNKSNDYYSYLSIGVKVALFNRK